MTTVHLIITPQINDPQMIAAMICAAKKMNATEVRGIYIKRKQDADLTQERPLISHLTIYELEQSASITAQQINEHLKNTETIQSLVTISNTLSKEWLPAFAALRNIMPITDVIHIAPPLFKRPIFAGNLIETLENKQTHAMISIRPQFFKETFTASTDGVIDKVTASPKIASSETLTSKEQSELPDLITAKTVISGGRGLGSKENFDKIHALAKHLNTAVGASRAAVDLGYISNEHQVGQTGKIIAPDIYIAFGISGAVQHLAGIKDSGTIIAINKDPDAPIFEFADVGYVGDLFEVIDALMK
jgi:electron transfer flavoprotein alpha subunit